VSRLVQIQLLIAAKPFFSKISMKTDSFFSKILKSTNKNQQCHVRMTAMRVDAFCLHETFFVAHVEFTTALPIMQSCNKLHTR